MMRDTAFRSGLVSRRRRPPLRPVAEALEGRALLSLAASQLLGSHTTSLSQLYETTSVELDAGGNTVVGGSFYGTVDLDPTRTYGDNRDILTSSGARDAFVAKFNAAGAVLWSRGVGATKDDRVAGVALDAAGNVYASGFITDVVNFGGGLNVGAANHADIFVWKLNGNTGANVYVTSAPGVATDRANQALDVAVTPGGDAFVSGFITSATTFGGTTLTPVSQVQGVVARLNAAGSFTWAVTYSTGATDRNFFERIAVDKDNHLLATGAIATPANGGGNILIHKYNGNNGSVLWSRTIGGPGYDAGSEVTTDPVTGDIYAVGRFVGPVDFNPGVNTPGDTLNAPIGSTSFYVLKLDTNGNYKWVHDLGVRSANVSGTTAGIGRPSIALDSLGRVVAAVPFQGRVVIVPGQVFGPGPDGTYGTSDDIISSGGIIFDSQAGSIDTALIRLNETNGAVIEARRLGGNGSDTPTGLASRPGSDQPVVLVGNYNNAGGGTARLNTAGLTITPAANVPQNADSIYIARFTERYTASQPPTDFDGDGRGDLIVYDPMRSDIFIKTATLAANQRIFGPGALFTGSGGRSNATAPQTITGDFDGDGLADVAVFRPDTSQFYILYSDLLSVQSPPANINQMPAAFMAPQPFFFGPGALYTGARFNPIPVAGDLDGDGRDDMIVYDPMSSTFFVQPSNPGASNQAIQFGPTTSNSATVAPVLVSADVNGDNRDDLIIYRPDTATFYIRLSGATLAQNAGTSQFTFGPVTAGNRFPATPIVGDFDGDNKAEFGVYDPMESRILLRNTTIYYNGAARNNIQFGPAPSAATTAPPTLGVSDLNGDGRDDLVVYDPMTSRSFSLFNAINGTATATAFGPALNTTRNLHAPTASPAPAIASLNPRRTVAVAARVATVNTINILPPPEATTVTPLDLTPVIGRRRASVPALTTLD